MLYGDQLEKHHEKLWGDQVKVITIVTVRDESGSDWCGGVKMSVVAGLERYLGDKSPYNLVMFQVCMAKGEESIEETPVFVTKILLPVWKSLETEELGYRKKIKVQIWDVLCFGCL